MSEAETLKKIGLLEQEISTLTDEVLGLKRAQRAIFDDMHIEIETIKMLLAEGHSDFDAKFAATRYRADREVSPE